MYVETESAEWLPDTEVPHGWTMTFVERHVGLGGQVPQPDCEQENWQLK